MLASLIPPWPLPSRPISEAPAGARAPQPRLDHLVLEEGKKKTHMESWDEGSISPRAHLHPINQGGPRTPLSFPVFGIGTAKTKKRDGGGRPPCGLAREKKNWEKEAQPREGGKVRLEVVCPSALARLGPSWVARDSGALPSGLGEISFGADCWRCREGIRDGQPCHWCGSKSGGRRGKGPLVLR